MTTQSEPRDTDAQADAGRMLDTARKNLETARRLLVLASQALDVSTGPAVRTGCAWLLEQATLAVATITQIFIADLKDSDGLELERDLYVLASTMYVLRCDLCHEQPTDGSPLCNNPIRDAVNMAARFASDMERRVSLWYDAYCAARATQEPSS